MISLDLAIWVAAIFNLLHWSYLYKETRLFRFSEHTFVALTVANGLVFASRNIMNLAITPLLGGQIVLIIPIILGLTTWTILSTKYAWISRYAMCTMIGVGTGIALVGTIKANITGQLVATINQARALNLNNAIMIIIVLSTFIYFFFTTSPRIPKPLADARSVIEKIARYSMMAAFGTVIGGDIFARIAMMTSRIIFLLKQWLGL